MRLHTFITILVASILALPLAASGEVDIEIVSFIAPVAADPGEPIGDEIHLRIRNAGPDDIIYGFSVGFYISWDEVITLDDQLLIGGREFVGDDIPAGEEIDVPLFAGARIPDDYPLGPAFLGVVVDESNIIDETDETNNTAASPVSVGGGVATRASTWEAVRGLFE